MPTTLRKTAVFLTGATVALWLGFAVWLAGTAHAADFFQDTNNATEAWGWVTNGDNTTICEVSSVNKVQYFAGAGDATTVDKFAVYVNNAGGSDCTSIAKTGVLYYCPTDADCNNGTMLTQNCTITTTSLAAGTTGYIEFDCADNVLMRRVFSVGHNAGTGTNCTSTKNRYSSSDVFGGTTCYASGSQSEEGTFRIYGAVAPPVISNIVENPATYNASVTWDTDTSSSSKFCWATSAITACSSGTGLAFVNSSAEVTSHSKSTLDTELTTDSLLPATTYHFMVCSTSAVGTTCSADDTFTTDTPADNSADPITTIYAPSEDQIFPSPDDVIGFLAYNDTDSEAFPGLTMEFELEVYNDVPALIYSSSEANNTTFNVLGTRFYARIGSLLGGFDFGEEYTMRVRTRYEGEAPGDWSDTRTFSIAAGTPLDTLGSLDCATPEGDWWNLFCLVESAGEILVMPNAASKLWLEATMDDFSSSDSVGVFGDAVDITDGNTGYCPLPTFTSSKFGHAGSFSMPVFDLCDSIEDVADDLNEIAAWQTALSVVMAVLGLIVAVLWFRKFVEG